MKKESKIIIIIKIQGEEGEIEKKDTGNATKSYQEGRKEKKRERENTKTR